MQVYFPIRFIDVPASPPHDPTTSYRVSTGREHWGDGHFAEVEKIQMVYRGRVSGRRSPSFPIGSADWAAVNGALEQLRRGEGARARGQMSTGSMED